MTASFVTYTFVNAASLSQLLASPPGVAQYASAVADQPSLANWTVVRVLPLSLAPPPSSSSSSGDNKDNTAIIAGSVCGGVGFLALCCCFCARRKRAGAEGDEAGEHTARGPHTISPEKGTRVPAILVNGAEA